MIELEKTYLAKFLPSGLSTARHEKLVDIYIPKQSAHPTLRIRQRGDQYRITKKAPLEGNDSSRQLEQTIVLDSNEFETLSCLEGKHSERIRYYYDYKGCTTMVDVFAGPLEGLVWVDVEFDTIEEKDEYPMPDFCLADVTQEKFLAGGMIAGKTYEELEPDLNRFNYKKLKVNS